MEVINLLSILIVAAYASANTIKKRDAVAESFHHNSAEFAIDLLLKVANVKGPEDNIVIAPFSVQTALGLVYFGTSENTAEEFVSGIKLVSNEKSTVAHSFKTIIESYSTSPILHVANKLFVNQQYEIKPEFQDIAKNSFYSEVENVDFAQKEKAATTINEWVDTKTNHIIKSVVNPSTISDDAEMILVNAVHFKADWDKPFKSYLTRKELFHHQPGQDVEVEMMSFNYGNSLFDPHFNFGKFEELGAKALELKYKDSDFSMLFVLPNEGKSLADVESSLQHLNLLDIANKMERKYVRVQIPRFKIEFSELLNEPLYELGLKSVFSDAAHLDGIFKGDVRSKISKVIHKTLIEVDEKGTEAAGVTAIEIVPVSAPFLPELPETFYADRPFIFAIKDKAAVHFVGRYTGKEHL